MLLWGTLGLAVIVGLGSAYYVMFSMPGRSYTGAFQPLRADEMALHAHLKQHVRVLAGEIGERQFWRPAALERAAQYIEAMWQAQGYQVSRQPIVGEGQTGYKLQNELSGSLSRACV